MVNGMKFDTFTLGNRIQVLTVSDARFVKSSAAMAVMAGSMENPEEHLGLAHFLEHMLFLGTTEYPEVGEYEDFLNKNGGGHNAYTSIDHTNYFFDVVHSGFEGALKRFSRFFVSPTFDEKYVEREKNAVHSEHEKNLKEDGRREYRFQQVITDPKHPFSKFATGDRETLKNASRDVVMEFYNGHYSSNLMRLVLMSDLESAELKSLAEKHFNDVVDRDLSVPTYSDQLFVEQQKPYFHKVESVRDQDVLKVSFDMPNDLPFWKTKPTSFLTHLVGEEAEGSLLSYLKKEGLALGLETSSWWRMFHVRVKLSEKGKTHTSEIIKAIFSYIELLKKEGLKDYLFKESQILAEVDLANLEPKSSMSRASNFSASMLYYPVDDFLNRYYLYHEQSNDDFQKFLQNLRPDNMQVTLLTQQSFTAEKEPYYGIGYESECLPAELIKELQEISIYADFAYPQPNPYVPTDLSLVMPPGVEAPKKEIYKNYCCLFSQTDTELEIPRGSISLSFISDIIHGDPKNYVMAKLFSKCKKEELNEWGYPARLTGLNYSISHGYNTITLDVSGLSQHLAHLLSALIFDEDHGRQINKVSLPEDLFKRVKLNYKKALENKDHDAAYQQLLAEVGHFFASSSVHRKEYMDLIDDITLADINKFAAQFFSKVSLRSFSFGNISGDSVKPVIDLFFDKVGDKGLTPKEVENFENKYVELPEKPHLVVDSGGNNNNAQISLYKMDDWSIRSQAQMDVLSKIIEQPYFTELRTHQQLGYVVAAFASSSNGFSGIGTLIQTQNFTATDAYQRSNDFVFNLLKELKAKMSDNDVEAIKSSIISEIVQKPNSLNQRLSRFTMMAGTYHGDFNFLNRLKEEVEKVTATDLQKMIGRYLDSSLSAPNLCFHYNGSDSDAVSKGEGFIQIQDVAQFKAASAKFQPYRYT